MDESLRRNARRVYEKHYGKLPPGMQVHHKKSWHYGGTNELENLMAVTTEEHFDIHYQSYIETGNILDLRACQLLAKNHLNLSIEQIKLVAAKGGKAAQKTLKRLQIGAYYDPELKKHISSSGGKNGNFRIECIMRRGHTEKEAKDVLSEEQSERGKRGGPKNKGFIWYNNGKNDFKYTISQQNKMPFDDFLKSSGYTSGRLVRCIVSDGETRIRIPLIERDDFLRTHPSYSKSKRSKL